MRIAELAGLKVAIWGMGREGHAAHLALRQRLPGVALTLFCNDGEAQFLASGHAADRYVAHAPSAADLSAFDIVIKSPGISAYRPELLDAQRNGTRFTSATALWFAENPQARVIAVTGTKGKSTTTALIAHLLRGLGRRTALAGNIGLPLLELLDPPQQPEWWVIELSSFQTRQAGPVELGVITNVEEEHLDWHGDRERYVSDKLALAEVAKTLLVNAQQDDLLHRTSAHPRRLTYGSVDGWHVRDGWIRCAGNAVFDLGHFPVPGEHNAMNACAALSAIAAAGEDARSAAAHLASFRPLPHRLQTLGVRDSITWIDDSIATTPQAAIAALRSLEGRPVTLILGGFDRGLDWQAFAEHVRQHPPHAIVANGATGPRIAARLKEHAAADSVFSVETLAEAVACARTQTTQGGVVLLSPGAPSFDQFHDYAERGRRFAELAGFDPEQVGQIEGLGIL